MGKASWRVLLLLSSLRSPLLLLLLQHRKRHLSASPWSPKSHRKYSFLLFIPAYAPHAQSVPLTFLPLLRFYPTAAVLHHGQSGAAASCQHANTTSSIWHRPSPVAGKVDGSRSAAGPGSARRCVCRTPRAPRQSSLAMGSFSTAHNELLTVKNGSSSSSKISCR